MTEFDFVKVVGEQLEPLGVKLSVDNRSGVHYLVADSTECVLSNSDWTYFFSGTLGEFLKRMLRTQKITVHEINTVSDNTVELNLGTVFDLLKDINHG